MASRSLRQGRRHDVSHSGSVADPFAPRPHGVMNDRHALSADTPSPVDYVPVRWQSCTPLIAALRMHVFPPPSGAPVTGMMPRHGHRWLADPVQGTANRGSNSIRHPG